MLLGALLAEFRDEGQAEAALICLGDLSLTARIDKAREPHGESLGEYVSNATARFARLASDEDWLALMTALERSEAPAATCLSTMLGWALRRDTAEVARGEVAGRCCAVPHDDPH